MAAPALNASAALPRQSGKDQRLWPVRKPSRFTCLSAWAETLGRFVYVDPEREREAEERRAKRAAVDAKLAELLIAGGMQRDQVIEVVKDTITDIYLDGSGEEILVEAGEERRRRIGVFEETHAGLARPCRRWMEFWQQSTGAEELMKQLRMMVVSMGLVPAADLRVSIRQLRKMIRRMAKDPILEALGVEIEFANWESTIYRLIRTGELFYNLHSHMLVRCKKFLPDYWVETRTGRRLDPNLDLDRRRLVQLASDYKRDRPTPGYERHSGFEPILERLRHLNHHKRFVHDAGVVRDFSELLKYATKASTEAELEEDDVEGDKLKLALTDLAPSELVDYANAIFRTNRFQFYGELRRFKADHEYRFETADRATGQPLERPRRVKQKVVVVGQSGDEYLGLVDVWSRGEIDPDYDRDEHDEPATDIIIGHSMKPNRDNIVVGVLRVKNPSLQGLEHLLKKRGLVDFGRVHDELLARNVARGDGREAALPISRTPLQLSFINPPAGSDPIGLSTSDPPIDKAESDPLDGLEFGEAVHDPGGTAILAALSKEKRAKRGPSAAQRAKLKERAEAKAARLAERVAADRRREYDRKVVELCRRSPVIAAYLSAFPGAVVETSYQPKS